MRMIVALLAVGFLTAAHAQTKPQNWDARLALTQQTLIAQKCCTV